MGEDWCLMTLQELLEPYVTVLPFDVSQIPILAEADAESEKQGKMIELMVQAELE